MPDMLEKQSFLNPMFSLLEETFETHHGIYLDANTSLIQTLAGISAQQASIPVGGNCATLAAQVAHVTFYLEVLEGYTVNNERRRVDWGEIWRTVAQVSPAEWEKLQEHLKEVYARLIKAFHSISDWNEDQVAGTMAVIVHTAYHLGEIRQALCVLTEQ